MNHRLLRNSLHADLIAGYLDARPGTKTKGFPEAMRKLVAGDPMLRDQVKLEGWELEPIGFSPDAFRVDRRDRRVTIAEAEVTSRISRAKWPSVVRLWWLLDVSDWSLFVHTIDRSGAVYSVNMPLVAVRERQNHLAADVFFRELAASPPGQHIWTPSAGTIAEDDWPDAVAAFVQSHPLVLRLSPECASDFESSGLAVRA